MGLCARWDRWLAAGYHHYPGAAWKNIKCALWVPTQGAAGIEPGDQSILFSIGFGADSKTPDAGSPGPKEMRRKL
jgi:hypothetical protein